MPAAVISLDRPLGLADDYVTAKWNLQSTKCLGGDYGWGVRVGRPFGARRRSSVRYRTWPGNLKES